MSIFSRWPSKVPSARSTNRDDNSEVKLGFPNQDTTGYPRDLLPTEQPSSIVFTTRSKDGETSTVEVLALSNLLHMPSEDEG